MRLRPGTALLLAALATVASRAQAPLRPQPGEPVAVRSAPSPEAEGFRSPLDVPLKLTGTFGELRSNHFHAGLDVATEGVTGLPVYACADGWVRRISLGLRAGAVHRAPQRADDRLRAPGPAGRAAGRLPARPAG
jgi:murein DD-endopeptidase MepM/ murein hydrolase activator NlpD